MSRFIRIIPGTRVEVKMFAPGGPIPQVPVAVVQGIILNTSAGQEYDVLISPAYNQSPETKEHLAWIISECDMDLEEIREGPVYVLRNMNREWISLTG